MSVAKKIKMIVKKVAPSATFGKDPSDPWSTKAGITEGALETYLKSRGINPNFLSRDTKISHSRSAEFLKWKQDHMIESMTLKKTPVQVRQHALDKSKSVHQPVTTTEEVNGKDTVTMDIPFLIRVLEYAREDAKDDMALHKVVEKLIDIRNKGTLTMDDYDFVTKIKEEYMDEGAFKRIATDREEDARLKKMSALDKFRADAAAREKKHAEIQKKSGGMTAAIDRLQAHLNKEDVFQDTYAATQTSFDGANAPDNTEPKMPGLKREMSKSARIIKSIYKRKQMKEELYDHEKEDKSVATYGKKPKMAKADVTNNGDSAPEAAAVLSGGKTLTGQTRDTLEIDPMMKRPTRPDQKQINNK